MNRKVVLAIAALVIVGVMLTAVGVGAQLLKPEVKEVPKVPKEVPRASDATCAALVDEIMAAMEAQDGPQVARSDVTDILRKAEEKGKDLTAANVVTTDDMSASDWTTGYVVGQGDWNIHLFLINGYVVYGGLMWDEASNDLDMDMWTFWDYDWSYSGSGITEDVRLYNYYPLNWVFVYVDHWSGPTSQGYMVAVDGQ